MIVATRLDPPYHRAGGTAGNPSSYGMSLPDEPTPCRTCVRESPTVARPMRAAAWVLLSLAGSLLIGCDSGGRGGDDPVPAPTLRLTVAKPAITAGESVTLTWTSTNATSVVASTFGATTVNGTKTVSPTRTTTYTLTVSGRGGQASDSLTVTVTLLSGSLDAPGGAAGEERLGPDGGTYVWVPAGEFMMGSEESGWYDSEKPQHRVQLTRGFWLSRCEATNAQYRCFCEATGRGFPWDSGQGDDHPVTWVSWEDAQAYCAHYGLRLPTEAEWEFSARGVEGWRYPWGDEWDETKCCHWGNRGPRGKTFPVGSFPSGASWCGALDLAGNVWEWCEDRYAADYYSSSPGSDPQGPQEGMYRVFRGGSWGNGSDYCRTAYRYRDVPDLREYYFGFRPAASPG